jgi:hypothetical protein
MPEHAGERSRRGGGGGRQDLDRQAMAKEIVRVNKIQIFFGWRRQENIK